MKHAFIGVAIALGLLTGSALAQQPPPERPPAAKPAKVEALADVVVLHATNGKKKGIDKNIEALPFKMPQLSQPPLSSYDSYELLDSKQLELQKNVGQDLQLPDKRALQVKLEDVIAAKKANGKPRYVLRASITKAGGKEVLPLLKVTAEPEEVFFVAGPPYKEGILVIGMRVMAK
jgi:hypothetical protein